MINFFQKEKVFVQTHSGKKINILSPKYDDIELEDIAHALSFMPRFGGHLEQFFSVAQHSILVAELCDIPHKKWAMLHDASEAYIADIITPLKKSQAFSNYRKIEKNLQSIIYKKFGLEGNLPKEVDEADKKAFYIEMANFYPKWHEQDMLIRDYRLCALSPELAKKFYLNQFKLL